MTFKGQFKVPIYSATVHIVVSDNVKRSINYYARKYKEDEIDFSPAGYCYRPYNDGKIGTLFLFFDIKDLDVDTIDHEKSHLVDYILEDRDIKPRNEVRAYLDGFIGNKINLFFKRRKKKIKIKDK